MRQCYVGNRPYVAVEGKEGCQCSSCLEMRAWGEANPANYPQLTGLIRLASDRETGLTQNQKAQEIFQEAKDSGRDIQAVRGRRTATQKFKDGSWVPA